MRTLRQWIARRLRSLARWVDAPPRPSRGYTIDWNMVSREVGKSYLSKIRDGATDASPLVARLKGETK